MWKPTILVAEKQQHATIIGTELVLYLFWHVGYKLFPELEDTRLNVDFALKS